MRTTLTLHDRATCAELHFLKLPRSDHDGMRAKRPCTCERPFREVDPPVLGWEVALPWHNRGKAGHIANSPKNAGRHNPPVPMAVVQATTLTRPFVNRITFGLILLAVLYALVRSAWAVWSRRRHVHEGVGGRCLPGGLVTLT